MKKLLCILLCIFSFASVFSIKALAEEEQVIQNDTTGIPDKNLYKSILFELKKKENETFTKAEAASVTWLTIYANKKGTEITTFAGLEHLTGLNMLGIIGGGLKDLNEISKLKTLTRLSIRDSNLENLQGIENLTNLEWLDIVSGQFTDVSGIEKLQNLTALVIENNLKVLPDLKALTKLRVKYTGFAFNKLSEKELRSKLPPQLLEEPLWLQNQLKFQNIRKGIKITRPKRITAKTKKIKGKVHKKAYVKLILWGGKKLQKVRADKNGRFCFRKLKLKKYKGKTIFIDAYMRNSYYNENNTVGTLQLKIKKK